jgi:pyruvate dehydrogenase E2 component (dihydrolipoamide acetyltransferase)
MTPIIMPQVGQDLPTGTVVRWLKRENDPVRKGETILEVESEKATFEIEAEQSGVLLKILYQEGQEAEILKPVGYIGQPGEKWGEEPAGTASPSAVAAPAKEDERLLQTAPGPVAAMPERMLASPSVRRLAREKGVDLARVTGSGPDGRIVQEDVLAAAEKPAAAAPATDAAGADVVVPFGKMRKRIAERLTASKKTIPHFYLLIDVDMTEAIQWRRSFNAQHAARITITDLFIKAAATALRAFPRINAHVDDQQLLLKQNVNIGVAVSVDDGLLVPVVADADQKKLMEIAELSKANAEAARRGVQKPGPTGTFTVTSLGMHGVKQFIPIINPPEAAILAIGAVQPRVVPVPGGIGVRQLATLTLACDHRSVDGADAAGLLNRIKHDLEAITDVQGQWV